jgi:hypothetical protein
MAKAVDILAKSRTARRLGWAAFLVFAAAPCLAQPGLPTAARGSGGVAQLPFASGAEEAARLAATDIRQGKPRLLLQGGIAPVVHASDSIFENKYGLRYEDAGCTGPAPALSAAYDTTVFRWLENSYGRQWQQDVRKDVLGYRMWLQGPGKAKGKLQYRPQGR